VEERGADGVEFGGGLVDGYTFRQRVVVGRGDGADLLIPEVTPGDVAAEVGEAEFFDVVGFGPGIEGWEILAPIEVGVGEVAEAVVGAAGGEIEERDAVRESSAAARAIRIVAVFRWALASRATRRAPKGSAGRMRRMPS